MLTIAGRHNGRQIFTDVVLMPINKLDGIGADLSEAPNIQVLNALIDTGATETSIVPAAARKLNLDPLGVRAVITSGGRQLRPYYVFRVGFVQTSGSSKDMVIPDLPIEGMEMPDNTLPFDILLGMDVISQGKLVVTRRRFEFTYNPT